MKINAEIYHTALAQSALDMGCTPESFLQKEPVYIVSRTHEQARKYLALPHLCSLTSYGSNIVACGREDLLPLIQKFVAETEGFYHCFETPSIYRLNALMEKENARVCFMAEYFLPDMETFQAVSPECPYSVKLLMPHDFENLYLPCWSNALCESRRKLDVLAVGAYDGDRLIGLAGCSADCETMWQIGVDVLPAWRKKGVAAHLTHRLAQEILRRDKVPFYCAAWSNIASVRNALKSGFLPAWAEMTVKENAFIEKL